MDTVIEKQIMPVLFVSHGSPMLAVDNDKARDFKEWGSALPKPKAILVFSAHWEGDQLALGENKIHNELIYDFSGFPENLYKLQYPAPGSQWLAETVQEILRDKVNVPITRRGLDHGVWVPFLHLWPQSDIPVMQMSMPTNLSNSELYELGEQLAPLREQGVIIVTSGVITHNLREYFSHQHDNTPADWAKSFDDWVVNVLRQRDSSSLLNWETQAPDAIRNHPTAEHFRPLLIAAGASEMKNVFFPVEGFDGGILSNRSVQFD